MVCRAVDYSLFTLLRSAIVLGEKYREIFFKLGSCRVLFLLLPRLSSSSSSSSSSPPPPPPPTISVNREPCGLVIQRLLSGKD